MLWVRYRKEMAEASEKIFRPLRVHCPFVKRVHFLGPFCRVIVRVTSLFIAVTSLVVALRVGVEVVRPGRRGRFPLSRTESAR
jgi:hypothetical protein